VKKNNLTVIILFSVLVVSLLVYFILSGKNEKRYQWNENYQTASDQPYGTMFIKKLLASYRPGEKFILNDKTPLHQLLDSAMTAYPTDYVFIGPNLYLDDADTHALLNFIHSGNDAFVSSLYLPLRIVDSIFVNECGREIFLQEQRSAAATLNFYHATLHKEKGYTFTYREGRSDSAYPWRSLNPEIFCDSTTSVVPLGYQAPDLVNFCKLPYGSGNLYIHTNPIVFTNYFLAQRDKPAYIAGLFSHLRGKTIIFDEFSKSKFSNDSEPYNSPLSYFLRHPSLKYAWWMMLGGVLLYTLFTAKRKQRAIPVIEEKANTSLEFVKMISGLHYQNGDHMDIARKKMKFFLYFIRAKYGIYAQHFTEHHIERLAEKSKVDKLDIQIIFNEFNQIDSNIYNNPAADRLVRLYNAIENFYKHCK
jgi:hypothetical protein